MSPAEYLPWVTDDATAEDIHGPGSAGSAAPRTDHPIPAPCPICLKHVGHYDERHEGGAA